MVAPADVVRAALQPVRRAQGPKHPKRPARRHRPGGSSLSPPPPQAVARPPPASGVVGTVEWQRRRPLCTSQAAPLSLFICYVRIWLYSFCLAVHRLDWLFGVVHVLAYHLPAIPTQYVRCNALHFLYAQQAERAGVVAMQYSIACLL